ncbi:5-formyltetrahydrofolate cyclo-ligase [Flexivirga caeni]|nr:5-formyltetrahydrofolate cyclo-ligase [Flexivirga caeni]
MPSLVLPPDKPTARRVVRDARRRRRAHAGDAGWAAYGENLARGLARWLRERSLRPKIVALYDALPTEPPTSQIRDALISLDVQLLVPILLPDNDLSWQDPATGRDLGVAAIATADLVLTPGLAVARGSGLRLGQGGGSYDRALLRVPERTPVVTMLFDDELVAAVPADSHDLPVSAVLNPSTGVTPVGRGI